MHSREELSGFIERYIDGLGFPDEPSLLYEPLRYSLAEGGKRLRPLLVLMAGDVFGAEPAPLLPLAAAVEVFHTFTLLHDDIMDNAIVRRGKPSVHARWGANAAILSGDAMVIYAYKLLAQSPPEILPRLLDEFNSMAAEVCEGQQYDMDFEERDDISIGEYMDMISLKTAALTARAAGMGAIAAGACEECRMAMYRFGLELGLAFQLQDDLLDCYGDERSLGKNVGGDIAEGKKSFLTVAAMSVAKEEQKRELASLLSRTDIARQEKIARVTALYDEAGVRASAEKEIRRHLKSAIDSLGESRLAAYDATPLRNLAEGLANREK